MSPGNKIFAVNSDGTEKWHYDTGDAITSDPAIGDDGTIYIGSMDDYLYAMCPNGTLRWRFKTGHYVKGPPSIANDGTIYIGSWDDYLYALYPNGTMKWKCKVGAGTETNPSIASDGTIYVGGQKLYAIYPDGILKWTFDLGPERHIHHSSPAISSDDTIYTGVTIGDGAGGEIIAVNPDGTEKWRKKIAEFRVDSSPCIGEDGTVYIGSSYDMGKGYLHAFNRAELEAHAEGPEHGLINVPVQFTGSASGGYPDYSYHWDFGDETTSTEQNPAHTYTNPGNFTVMLTVTDDEDNTSSDTIWIYIQETNSPPNTPTIDGPTNGEYDTKYDYTISTIDLDDNPVYYYVEWGDGKDTGWIGQYDSGEEIIKSHKWTDRGAYTIRVKAKDVFDEESDWATLEVTMPKNKPYINTPFIRFLENHPHLFPLLRQLMGL
jgi:outer membrane protein assembly factor BamB